MDARMHDADYWIKGLKLIPHPEGGYYQRNYCSPDIISEEHLSGDFDGERSLTTSIYFLLTKDAVSHFHRLKSDELWYYHAGAPLTVYVIHPDGKLERLKLGLNLENGETPQVLVPRGTIFGSAMNDTSPEYSLVGCVVSPGFDFDDFELFDRNELVEAFPQHKDVIVRLTPVAPSPSYA